MAPIRSVLRPNYRCTSGGGEGADRPARDRRARIVRKGEKGSEKCVQKQRKRERGVSRGVKEREGPICELRRDSRRELHGFRKRWGV